MTGSPGVAGALPIRTAMGHGPRGLQRRRRCLGLLHPRPGPLARLPLGRGRDRRISDDRQQPLLRARPLERPRPDPQGAPVRPDEQRGQPRRGRQGVLLLPRRDADALVHELALQVPAGGLPVRRPGRDEPRPRRDRARVRAARHRRVRRGPLLRCRRRVRQGEPGRHPRSGSPPEPRAGARDAPPPPDPLVPQHLVVGRRRPPRPEMRSAVGDGTAP